MTIREYAKENGFRIVGKLTKKVSYKDVFNYATGRFETKSTVFWLDEAGNTFTPNCIVTADGAVI